MQKHKIQMVDLHGHYLRLKPEIDEAIARCISNSSFIKGKEVELFEQELSTYLDNAHVATCGNGTDALQLALMALKIGEGDEVILPAFNFVASAEAVALLGARPVFCDVNPLTCNMDTDGLAKLITEKTKAVIAVHLFGQCANLNALAQFCKRKNLFLIEDNAQAIGAKYELNNEWVFAGLVGEVATTSFFPSKNLGAMGDGGACYSKNKAIIDKIKLLANHGQPQKYTHTEIGLNSRLDGMQAAILRVKLKNLNDSIKRRQSAAAKYNESLQGIPNLTLLKPDPSSEHVYHQFTVLVENRMRDDLKTYLAGKGIPTMIYYPTPLDLQPAYKDYQNKFPTNPLTDRLSKRVLSLPMHTELKIEQIDYIAREIRKFLS